MAHVPDNVGSGGSLEKVSIAVFSYCRPTWILPYRRSSPSLIFSLLTFYTSEFLPGSASSWLCFSSVHIVGTLVSKLPSIIPFLSRSVATDGQDGHGLKIGKIGLSFSSFFECITQKDIFG